MNTHAQRPKLLQGGIVGVLLTLPLIALLYVGEAFAGLPFVPFDVFDWVARNLPGSIITFGIDTMVDTMIALGLGGDLDSNAKIAERMMALALFVTLGVVIAVLFFAVLNRLRRTENAYVPGVIAGLIFALPLIAISFNVNISATADTPIQLVWLLLVFAAWGAALGWIYSELAGTRIIKTKADGTTIEAMAEPINRRQFLVQVGGATATMTVIGAGLGAFLNNQTTTPPPTTVASAAGALTDGSGNPLPNANDPVVAAPGTRPEYTPLEDHYRIDILSGRLPAIDEATWTLPITGLVANEVNWTLDELRAMPARTDYITMSCISNRIGGTLISTIKWTGVSLQHILDQIQPTEDAVALKITGADNFDEFLMLDLIRSDDRIMLAYAFDDQPLPLRNGFPLRTHIPDRFGMKQPKWITGIEVVGAWEEGYWVRRGWSKEAMVRATSVIDTVSTDAIYEQNGSYVVPIGGIAWAGARGISAVEVRVDNGEWRPAQLRSAMSDRSWNIWRYDWEFTEGSHTFEVRCIEADGTPQIETIAPVRPDGATGIHSLDARLAAPAEDPA
jgi:DMSO/TMAO reductase YedYZ molybdopterin-dependent catalytic subunit